MVNASQCLLVHWPFQIVKWTLQSQYLHNILVKANLVASLPLIGFYLANINATVMSVMLKLWCSLFGLLSSLHAAMQLPAIINLCFSWLWQQPSFCEHTMASGGLLLNIKTAYSFLFRNFVLLVVLEYCMLFRILTQYYIHI